jgi:FMN phosphatase YigB (HAD superfamily)
LVTFAVLFDIDGTLVASVAAEDAMLCYLDAIRDVVGKRPELRFPIQSSLEVREN